MNTMVEDLNTIHPVQNVRFQVSQAAIDLLLFKFLNELIFLKDARRLLTRIRSVTFEKTNDSYTATASGFGETLDPEKHTLLADVKAATLHQFYLKEGQCGWETRIVLDI